MNNEQSDKKYHNNVCLKSNSELATAKNSRNKNRVNCGSGGIGISSNSSGSGGNVRGNNTNYKNVPSKAVSSLLNVKKSSGMLIGSTSTSSTTTTTTNLSASNIISEASPATSHSLQPMNSLVTNYKFNSNTSSPSESDMNTFTEAQPLVTDLSESDEESVSEILLACLCLRPDLLNDLPDSGSESCGHDGEGNDDEDDGDDEEEDEDEEIGVAGEMGGNFLLKATDQSKKLSAALFETNEKAPVIRHATLAIDEATQALTKMRCANSPRDKTIFSRTLIAACTDNDVNTVRRLLGKGNIAINESTDDGESLLSMACSAGYFELAQVLLAMSAAQVEDKGQKDCTPLMEAASAGYVEIIKLLISHKADVNAQSTTGNTPLMFACAGGHVDAVRELLLHGANVEDQNENGHTPLMEAASAGHVEVAKVLLEHGAGINTHSNEFKESALTLACYKGHLNMVRFLLQAGADQEHKTDEMHTALMEASMDGHVEVARLLLDSGAQVNMPTDSFESPLTLAACGGHVELATLLIERGANIEEVNDEGYTPLMEAAREGHEDMVALLLSKGANINATTEETQETALTLACCGGFMEVAEFLIKHGADLELGASTPLMEAAQEGHTELVRFLLANGANVHAQTQTGDTALTHACENGHTDAAEVLLYYGAELEHESEGGRTPLMKACRAGHICTVKFLISKGADVNMQTTNNDHTALSLACAGGHQAVVELLLKSGADPFHKLKDNSTMLIEAAKGGHIRVVETLFKYPNFAQLGDVTANALNSNNGQIQLQPINLQQQNQQQQQQQQLQQLTAPGLLDVPEAVRVSTHQVFYQQQFQAMDYLEEHMIPNTTEGFTIEASNRSVQQQNEALFAKMRLFQLQAAGFEDGLTQGLTRAQTVHQIINPSNSKETTMSQPMPSSSNSDNNKSCVSGSQEDTDEKMFSLKTNNDDPEDDDEDNNNNKSKSNKNNKNHKSNKSKGNRNKNNSNVSINNGSDINNHDICNDNSNNNSNNSNNKNNTSSGNNNSSNDGNQNHNNSGNINDGNDNDNLSNDNLGIRNNLYQNNTNVDAGSSFNESNSNEKNYGNSNNCSVGSNNNKANSVDIININSQGASTNIKQRSLLRKTRQAPAPFEVNLNISDAHQTRPRATGGEDEYLSIGKNFVPGDDQQQQQRRKLVQDAQEVDSPFQKTSIHIVCDGNNPSSSLTSSAYVDITTASAQDVKLSDSNNTFLPAGSNLPQLETPSSLGQTSNSVSIDNESLFALAESSNGATNITTTVSQNSVPTSTLITTPLEVSQSTAISDRPKVKPVSKKDAKNLRKASSILQQNQMVSIYNNLPLLFTTEQGYSQNQLIANVNASSQQVHPSEHGLSDAMPQLQVSMPNNVLTNSSSFQQLSDGSSLPAATSTILASETNGNSNGSNAGQDDQINRIAMNTPWNRKMLQMVAQMPNYPIQKIAQRIIIDQPKSPTEPSISCEKEIDSQGKGTDFVDISRALRDAVHDFRPDFNPSEIVQVMQPVTNVSPPKAVCINNSQQQFTNQQSSKTQYVQGTFNAEGDDHFHVFPMEDTEDKTMSECGMYPALSESLENFAAEDDGTREQICSYELGLGDCMEEFFNVFQGVNDPALQELATNLNCTEFAEFGINSFCKGRWSGQWVPSQSTHDIMGHQTANNGSSLCISEDMSEQRTANQILIDQHLQQQLQQRFSMEDLQILSQIQNDQRQVNLSLPPSANLESQSPPTIDMQSLSSSQTYVQQKQISSTASNTSPNASSATTLAKANVVSQSQQTIQRQQSQTQLQQQQILATDIQQQPKFLFNVDSDKPSQSLQLLFQLPQVQQAQHQQTPAVIPAQHQTNAANSQSIAQTQTVICRPLQPQVPQPNANLQQQSLITVSQSQSHYVSHSQQVQVATQTQQQSNALGTHMSPPATGGQFVASTTSAPNNLETSIQQTTTTKSTPSGSSVSKRSIDKASRKERNRYTVVRQAPSGSQANTTQQYTTQNAASVVDKTIDVDSETDSNHDTALTLACAGGHEELVELLISRGANIEHRDKKGFTPLILAATAGHEKVVDILLKHGAELEAQSERTKDTPLSLACSGGRYEVVELLLNVGANKEHRNVSDYTPLSLAASGGYVNIIKLLLSHGAEINSRTGSKLGISPLMLAAMNGHTAAVKLLLDMGSDINAQIETNRNTALTLACFQGRHEVVSLLLDRKANVEHRAKTGLTPLMEAASGGYIEVGRVLLDKGADVNAAPVPTSRDTALTIAADKGHLKFVELLLLRGASVEVKNKKGNSPLWLAAHGGHLAVVEALAADGADIDSQDNRRVSCLMAAFRKGHTKVVKWMVQHVTQFPSDQEMARFINTISDKELLDKCYECVKIIRAAKEAQAVKANKNASILLEELDMERYREESRRAAAARRRERKKKKKLEKKQEKRKMMKVDTENNGEEGEFEKEEDTDREDANANPNQLRDREEGDSGIDQGSCSSTDTKAANSQAEKQNKAKNKKKKNNASSTSTNGSCVATVNNTKTSNSPVPSLQEEKTVPKKKSDMKNSDTSATSSNMKAKRDGASSKLETLKKPTEKPENQSSKKEDSKKRDKSKDNSLKGKEKDKENLAPKSDQLKQVKQERKVENSVPIGTQKVTAASDTCPSSTQTSRKPAVIQNRHSTDKDDNAIIAKPYRNQEESKVCSGKSSQFAVSKTVEGGWKEVVRKSGVQQQSMTNPLPAETSCKKVQVPVNAISRVIGRAGSNINAIRATTGAHIEVEKQGKSQSDRCITIKGLPEATKQAHFLISSLIKDPDVDILQMLSRTSSAHQKSTTPVATSTCDKSTPLTSQSSIASAPSITTVTNVIQKNPKLSQASTSSVAKTSVTSSSSKPNMSTSIQRQNTKGFLGSQGSRSANIFSNMSSLQTKSNSENFSGLMSDKSVSVASPFSMDSLKNGTKTTVSYTHAIMALNSSAPKSSACIVPSSNGAQTTGTFASKLNTSGDKKLQTLTTNTIPSPGQNIGNFHSPKRNSLNFYDIGDVFGPKSRIPAGGAGKSLMESSQASIDSRQNCISPGAGRSLTPVNMSNNSNRNTTTSPLAQHGTLHGEDKAGCKVPSTLSTSAATIQPPGLVSQLQTKISHEYCLFNDSFSNQWSVKPIYTPSTTDTLPKADASKAPGYNRGNLISSPVNYKLSVSPSNSASMQDQVQNINILPASDASVASCSTSHSSSQSEVDAQEVFPPSEDLACALKPTGQNQTSAPSLSNGLAVQRPVMSNMIANRNITPQVENYGPAACPGREQTHVTSQNYYEQMQGPNVASQHQMNYMDSLQQSDHPQVNANQVNALPISRANPRTSVYSQQSKPVQQMSGSFHQIHPNSNTYQKLNVAPPNIGGNPAANYNHAPSRPQPQMNNRWFHMSDYGYIPSARDIMSLENGMPMNSSSPSMSPNNSQQHPAVGPPPPALFQSMQPLPEDNRKMPRPIGTERASWKYGTYPNMSNQEIETSSNAEPIPPWMMDKNQGPHQMQNWQKAQQQRFYVNDMHPPQEHFHLPMDCHIPLEQPAANTTLNLTPTMAYQPYIGHNEISHVTDKIDPSWEHDKHAWSSNWTN